MPCLSQRGILACYPNIVGHLVEQSSKEPREKTFSLSFDPLFVGDIHGANDTGFTGYRQQDGYLN